MKLYDDYKDGRIDRDSYKQRAGKIDNFVLLTSSRLDGDYVPIPT